MTIGANKKNMNIIKELPYTTRTFYVGLCESPTKESGPILHYAVINKATAVPEFQNEVLMVTRKWMDEIQSELDTMDGIPLQTGSAQLN